MFDFLFKKNTTKAQLFFHTDIHNHLLPGIDDGQETAEGGADLIKKEIEWGINRVICTPHITQDTFENTPETISKAFGKLKEELDKDGVEIDIDYSAEHRLDGFFLSQLEKDQIRPLPDNYILVENSYVQEAWNLDKVLFDLKIKGLRPILAHPERYSYYHTKQDRYRQLYQAGNMFQINLLSLAGYYGKEVRDVAEWLIKEGMVDFVATDMHNHRHSEAIDKYLQTKDYRRYAERLAPVIKNDQLFGKK